MSEKYNKLYNLIYENLFSNSEKTWPLGKVNEGKLSYTCHHLCKQVFKDSDVENNDQIWTSDFWSKKVRPLMIKTMIPPGESVGITCGQSLGEKQTQSTLNSFHSAGLTIKTVVTGVPRFSELMSATKEPKGPLMVQCRPSYV
eukprot:Pgem_evm10s16871